MSLGVSRAQIYKFLPNFSQSVQHFLERDGMEAVKELGNIIVRYKLHSRLAVCLVHTHFSLTESEILVEAEEIETGVKISSPWKLEDNKFIPWSTTNRTKIHQTMCILPNTWIFQGNGDLNPIEFEATENEINDDSLFPKEFVSSLTRSYLMLKQFSDVSVLGIRKYSNKSNHFRYETSRLEERANCTHIVSSMDKIPASKTIPTIWYFDDKCIPYPDMFCGACSI
ncbi:uncharacterized protein LOC110850286 [Folsomia candida]|uniref:Uncharacterized protein n=1 Tax=Folsomia candida TaxID=158441 RepID=A0A226ED94_FOLCA|nr:uncharacterized protein LOC110850286 [Folsomia candida]OXA54636.1 hypothetical protein Fcan01_10960 [Folsomia candida]